MNITAIPILSPREPAAVIVDIAGAVTDALRCAQTGEASRLTVLVNDAQRHTDTPTILREIRRQCGLPVRLLVACGTHAAGGPASDELARNLRVAVGDVEIAWHDCRRWDLVVVPNDPIPGRDTLPIGAAWRANPWLLEDGALLAIGSVEPHYFAGFTGAHKTVTVGCSSFDDAQNNHAHALSPQARPGRLEGNPVHDGLAAMLRGLLARRPCGAVNLVQCGRRIVASAGGGPLETLHALVPAARAAFMRRIDSPADGLILDVAGPLARSFYQADKAIKNNEWAVRDGGVIVLVAACEDGIGQDHFTELLRQAKTHAEAIAAVAARGYRLGDHKAVKLRYLTDPACRGVRVYVVSPGLSADDAKMLGMTKADSPAAALGLAVLVPGRDRIWRLADAGNLCVTVG